MKLTYQIIFLTGTAIFIYGLVFWAKSGFSVDLSNLSTMLFGTRPWNIDKDSGLFLVIIGTALSAYGAIELNLKRWERGNG